MQGMWREPAGPLAPASPQARGRVLGCTDAEDVLSVEDGGAGGARGRKVGGGCVRGREDTETSHVAGTGWQRCAFAGAVFSVRRGNSEGVA